MVSVHCVKSIRCNKQFKRANNDKLLYTIVHYTNESKNYKFDELNEYKEYTCEDLNILNKNKNANKIYIGNIEYAIKPGLGLIDECEFDLKDMTGKVVEPNSIFIENSDTNKEYNEEYNNKYIERKYDVKNNGKYNMNLIKAEALDIYVDC
ncbi:hypothetical protein H8356DRAFT_1277692 [Neocallimastix lanati (nom. inval.)]|nr:hypothetical protein H8356DRAFT_1277692 [Neocallimastix sp. JGI-2020a]